MKKPDAIESKFLVPVCEDKAFGSGRDHPTNIWKWLQVKLIERYGGYTSHKTRPGPWKDSETGEVTYDVCREYHVDIQENQLDEMWELLEEVAVKFQQKCIRFVYKGDVYYIANKELP